MLKRLITISVLLLAFGYTNSAFATINVKFQVHMGVQIQSGAFNPATDSVVVRGDFQTMAGDTANWNGYMFLLTASAANDSIYEITVGFADSAANHTIQFKYVIVHNGSDTWESLPNGMNRTYDITSDPNQVIPLAYFNIPPGAITLNITFQADMTTMLNEGFAPGSDSIEVMGDTYTLNWTPPGSVLNQDLIDPTLFLVTIPLKSLPGLPVQWKFHADPSTNFTNGGWEDGGNHTFTFPMADTTLDPVQPNMHVATPTTDVNHVYFRVDMNGAHEAYHNTLITGLSSVWLGGSAPPLQWPTNSWIFSDTSNGSLTKMYDDGTHTDSIAGDKIFSNMIDFPVGTPAAINYKYGAVFDGVDTLNGGASYLDNEAGFGNNHLLSLIIAGGTVYKTNVYGDQATGIQQIPDNNIPATYTLSQNYPNPFNPTTNIVYTVPKSGMVTLKVYNILGQEVTTLFQGFQNTGKYVASFDASKFASGIYIYRLQSGNTTLTKKMMLLK